MPVRVAVLDDYQQVALTLGDWSALPDDTEIVSFADHIADTTELVSALGGFDVIVAMRERTALPAAVIDGLPALRLIVTTGMRNAAIDLDAATAAGVRVMGTSGTITPTSELTWALIFAVLRHLPDEAQRVRDGGWQETIGTGVAGKTLGVVGLGNLGKLVAVAGLAFQMRVIAWSQNLTAETATEAGAELVSKRELFSTADVVTVHLVLSDRTRHLVGEEELRSMKSSAVLINTSRGPIVDEAALLRALAEGWIAGAGLDVFDTEPLPPAHPLRSAPNAVLTPHIGYVTDDCYRVFYRHIVADIAAFLRGEPLRVLNPS
jgi:phosphoglycerate dehydrogenase-like enzyme